jgi:hypothetical protein
MSSPYPLNDVAHLPSLVQALSPQIAAELAAGLSSKEDICARYEISEPDWDALRTNPIFRGMVKEAMREFSGDMNAAKRTRLKANILYEDLLPEMYALVKDISMPSNSRVEAAKLLAKTGGVDSPEKENTGAAGNMFQVNINFSDPDKIDHKLVIQGSAYANAE